MGESMHEINLSNLDLRTDLIIEHNIKKIKNDSYDYENIHVDSIVLKNNNKLNKKAGKYITISYNDITDTDNYKNVLDVFKKELNNIFNYCKIKDTDKGLIIGLGNRNIISDALGSKCLDKIIVTRHLFLLNNVDNKYRNISILEPNVLGVTGIDSFEIIKSIIEKIKPDFIVAIDSLCAIDIRRLNKTIQITSSGITPGSGIGNIRNELSKETLGIKTIAIGVPTVVESISIVSDTINFILKKISYLKNNDKIMDKLKPINKIDYLSHFNELANEEKKEILGYIGLLNNKELKSLIWEVLSPLEMDMIVTPKEIDFIIDKLSKLISDGLNNVLHHID